MTDVTISINPDEFLWAQKYRPKTISECIIPENLKALFQGYVDKGEIPHFLLAGPPGSGKTTVARALASEIGADVLFVKAAEENGIDMIRNQIRQFCSTVSLTDSKKIVILDESDHISQAAQKALNGSLEEFSSNARFIFTCNFKSMISEAIHSRCTVVDFKIPSNEKAVLAKEMMVRSMEILHQEGVTTYDKKSLAALISKNFPDFRRTLNSLQRHATDNTIDSSVLNDNDIGVFDDLLTALRDKNFSSMRKWVGRNSDIDVSSLYTQFYKILQDTVRPECLPDIILLLADYQFKSSFSADQEICTTACLTEIMGVVKF